MNTTTNSIHATRKIAPPTIARTNSSRETLYKNLREDVVRNLRDELGIDAMGIEVRVKSGIVYLAGRVKENSLLSRAEIIAHQVKTALYVINELELAHTEATIS